MAHPNAPLAWTGRKHEGGDLTAPVPVFDAIDYTRPENYLFLHSSFVGPASLEYLAALMASNSAEGKLKDIERWISRNLECRNVTAEYGWRTVNEILSRGRYIGCADHALVYGCLARACGIPTVWVKTLDVAWIRTFRATGKFDGGKGHVYLEVFIDGKWRLLDADRGEVFDAYDPHQQLLPGGDGDRYAYDKGGDPRKLILSLDWNPWVQETITLFSTWDLQRLSTAIPAVGGPARKLAT